MVGPSPGAVVTGVVVPGAGSPSGTLGAGVCDAPGPLGAGAAGVVAAPSVGVAHTVQAPHRLAAVVVQRRRRTRTFERSAGAAGSATLAWPRRAATRRVMVRVVEPTGRRTAISTRPERVAGQVTVSVFPARAAEVPVSLAGRGAAEAGAAAGTAARIAPTASGATRAVRREPITATLSTHTDSMPSAARRLTGTTVPRASGRADRSGGERLARPERARRDCAQ